MCDLLLKLESLRVDHLLDDRPIWRVNLQGCFTVQSYLGIVAREGANTTQPIKETSVPPMVAFFAWEAGGMGHLGQDAE